MFFNRKKKKEDNAVPDAAEMDNRLDSLQGGDCEKNFAVPIEKVSFYDIADSGRLVEIRDENILARIDALIPGFIQAGAGVVGIMAAAGNDGEWYKAVLPTGAKLADSKALEGAKRGFYQGADGKILGHVNLVKDEPQTDSVAVAGTAAAAFAVAAMVVGQYYMDRIDRELDSISDELDEIAEFQDNEYRSRVFGLVSQVKSISSFQSEILENDELRVSKITQLDNLGQDCIELLGQANLTLVGFTQDRNLKYKEYEELLTEIQNWYIYQNILLEALLKISDLKYALHLGKVSREQCICAFSEYEKQTDEAQEQLAGWHIYMKNEFHIDIEQTRRERVGVDRLVHVIQGKIIDDKYNYQKIPQEAAKMIETQSSGRVDMLVFDNSKLYEEDVQLFAKDGRIYYMPEAS